MTYNVFGGISQSIGASTPFKHWSKCCMKNLGGGFNLSYQISYQMLLNYKDTKHCVSYDNNYYQ